MGDHEPLPEFSDRAPRDRFCDLVLTGGVTSSIAYPAAVFALAGTYRFNSIGGSSSGAGAAALAAAAEYRRRRGSPDGFRTLLARAAAVAEPAGAPNGKTSQTGLAWLFQPSAGNRRLFNALVPGVASPSRKFSKLLGGFGKAYALPMVLGVVLAAALVATVAHFSSPQGWVAYLSAGLIAALVAGGWAFACDLAQMADSDYGLCNGIDRVPNAPHPPLTEWLHGLIQEIAGRGDRDSPLTFADLISAPGSPSEALGDPGRGGRESIRLQMFTANVTHGRPYLLGRFDDAGDPPLYFRPSEMRRLFPATVVQHMLDHSQPHLGDEMIIEPVRSTRLLCNPISRLLKSSERAAPGGDDDALRLLPTRNLPIIVAARMSVSFPVLFSAVPLWALDKRTRSPAFRRCLFSDGGLCSNFPIHLFDSLAPAWPTFGISLHEQHAADFPGPLPSASAKATAPSDDPQVLQAVVDLPINGPGGQRERWSTFDGATSARERLFGFAGALLATTKDWNDAALARLPGVRDRIARVHLPLGIGGLNILMNRDQIKWLAKVGGQAGRELLERFALPSTPGGMAGGWAEHRWVRFTIMRSALASSLAGFSWSAAQPRFAQPLREQIRAAIDAAPVGDEPATQLVAAQAAALEGVLSAIEQAERALNACTVGQPAGPTPQPELRLRPPL